MNEAKLDLVLEKLDQVTRDVAGLKEDVAGLKQDVAGLKQDVAGLKQEIAAIHNRLDRHENMIVQLIGIVKSTNEMLTTLMERQNALEQKYLKMDYSLEILNREQLKMKADIEMLKNR